MLASLALCTGCMTEQMWQHTNETTLQFQGVAGLSAPAGRLEDPPRLVVRYGIVGTSHSDRLFAVPQTLHRTGIAKTSGGQMFDRRYGLQPAFPELAGYTFSERDERRESDIAPAPVNRQMTVGLDHHLLAIPIAADGLPTTLDGESWQRKPIATFAVVPAQQPRVSGERARAITLATVATPFVAVADCVVDPLGFVFLYFFWRE